MNDKEYQEKFHALQAYRHAVEEIEFSIESVRGLTKAQAVKELHGYNDEEYEDIFDFETTHAAATMVFENDKFERMGYGIQIFGSEGFEDWIDYYDELKFLAAPPSQNQVITFLREVQSQLIGLTNLGDECEGAEEIQNTIDILESLE